MKYLYLLIVVFALVSCASKEVSLSDKKADLYYSHGTAKLVEKDYTAALDYLLKAKAHRPDSKILNNLGMAYFFKGEVELAKKNLIEAIELDQKNSDARNNLASLYFHQKEYDLALKQYQLVLQDLVYRDQFRTHYNIALVYLAKNQYQKGVEHLHLSINEKKDYCSAHFKLGQLAKERGHYVEAFEKFKEASMGNCYNFPAPLYEQALVLIKMNKIEQAEEKLHQVVERFNKTSYGTLALSKLNELENYSHYKNQTKNDLLLEDKNLYRAPAF